MFHSVDDRRSVRNNSSANSNITEDEETPSVIEKNSINIKKLKNDFDIIKEEDEYLKAIQRAPIPLKQITEFMNKLNISTGFKSKK